MQTNVFLGTNADPTLGGNNYSTPNDYDAKIAELQAMQKQLEQQRLRTNCNYSKNVNSSPIWDEIEKLTAELTDREFDIINNNTEFQTSQHKVMEILQREYMRLMRPIVESTDDGRKALEAHLKLIKGLRKDAAHEVNKSMELFTEYTEKFSDMTYSDFLKMKKSNNKE